MARIRFTFISKLLVFFSILIIIFMACGPLPPPPPPPPSPPYLSAIYCIGTNIYLRETTRVGAIATFGENLSKTRHTLFQGSGNLSRPSATFHRNSMWFAFRENNTIHTRAIWWGPARTRTVYDGNANTPSAPAIISYNDRLIVVWGVGDTLYLSSSEFGVEWTPPLGKQFHGAQVRTPALGIHNNKLYAGVVFGYSLSTIRINTDLSWGPNFPALSVNSPVKREVSLASDGNYLYIGYAGETGENYMSVIRSANGYSNWSAPIRILSNVSNTAPPALYHYDNYLYAVFPTGLRLLMRRSPDGSNWNSTMFEVDPDVPGEVPTAALVGSNYSVVPPTPQVTVLNNSGYSPSSTFNIVLISEGYLDTEMNTFQQLAGKVFDQFKIINPFSKHADKFNMYRIDIPSREKGVDASPLMAAAVRQGIWTDRGWQAAVPTFQPRYTDTALGAEYKGIWDSPHGGGYCDASEDLNQSHTRLIGQKAIFIFTTQIYDYVQQLIPGFDPTRDVLYAIVDQDPADGGTEKASFVPIVSTNDFAEGLGNIHEMGHFMCGLSDEDFENCWGGIPTDCGNAPNKSVNTNLSDPNHKWAEFFVNEGRPGDSIVAGPVSRPPTWNNYWDPAVVNASSIFNVGMWASNGITDWSDTGGMIVYAPVQQCLMNHTGETTHFCPVCAKTMTQEIYDRSGRTFINSHYHGVYASVFVEYKHRRTTDPNLPKVGFISVNGTDVNVNQFTCYIVRDMELCSVDITPYVNPGINRLVFKQQSGLNHNIDLLTIQVVNSNGAPLAIFPITDLSGIGGAYYLCNYFWNTQNGNLEFEFSANFFVIPIILHYRSGYSLVEIDKIKELLRKIKIKDNFTVNIYKNRQLLLNLGTFDNRSTRVISQKRPHVTSPPLKRIDIKTKSILEKIKSGSGYMLNIKGSNGRSVIECPIRLKVEKKR